MLRQYLLSNAQHMVFTRKKQQIARRLEAIKFNCFNVDNYQTKSRIINDHLNYSMDYMSSFNYNKNEVLSTVLDVYKLHARKLMNLE